MKTLSLYKQIAAYEELSGETIKPEHDPHEQYEWFKVWLKDQKDEFTLDELAPVLELDYMDFSDYIEHIRFEKFKRDWYYCGGKGHLYDAYMDEVG